MAASASIMAIGSSVGLCLGTSGVASRQRVSWNSSTIPASKNAVMLPPRASRLNPSRSRSNPRSSVLLPRSSVFSKPLVSDGSVGLFQWKLGPGYEYGKCKGKGALSSEMNISVRIGRIMKSLVEQAVSGNEDPELLLEQAAIEMSNDLVKLRKASAQVLATKNMLEQKYKRAKAVSDTWLNRARRALELGDENLARDILRRRKIYEKNTNELKAQYDQQRMMASRIIECSKILEDKIAEARFKKNSLKGRAKAAKSAKYVSDLILSVDPSGALAAFDRMEEKIVRMEYETQAYSEIITDDLSLKFAKLESEDVEDEFKKLKADTFGPEIRRELPPLQREMELRRRGYGGGRMGSGF